MPRRCRIGILCALFAAIQALWAADIEDVHVLLEAQGMQLHLTERERGTLIAELVGSLRTPVAVTEKDTVTATMPPICTISILTNQSPTWRKLVLHGMDLLLDSDGTRYHFRYGMVVFDAIQRKTIDTQDWSPIK